MEKDRKKVIKGFGIFLLFMAACYLISKGIYTNSLPRVIGGGLKEGTISHHVESVGTLKQGQEFGIYVPQGLRVATTYAHVGEKVEEGTVLFLVDVKDLDDLITEKEIEIAGLKMQLEREGKLAELDPGETLARAKEDYELTEKATELEMARRSEAVENAKKTLEKYQQDKVWQQESVSGGDAVAANAAYDSTLLSLEQAVENAEWALKDAALSRERQLLQSSRNVEDAGENTTVYEQTDVELVFCWKKEQLERLLEIKAAQGRITATEAGVITNMELAVGERTGDGAACVYAKEEDTKLLEISLAGGNEKYVRIGDEVELVIQTSEGEETLEVPVEFMQTGEGMGIVSFYLENPELRMGQSVTFSFTRKEGPYDSCISTDALFQVSDGYGFVYVLEEREGFFGKEYAVHKEKVRVLDSNGRLAAIEIGGFDRSAQVVISTNKELKDGDIVRVD